MNQPSDAQRWYPHFDDHATHEAFRVAFDHLYSLHDQVQAVHSQLKGTTASGDGAKPASAGGPSTTKIGGLFVAAVPPLDGQTLKYNAKTGQIEWTT